MEEKVDFLTEYGKDDLFGGHALTDPINTIEVYILYHTTQLTILFLGQVETGACFSESQGSGEAAH